MPGGLRRVSLHSEISFLRLSVGCGAKHFSASLAVATSCRAASASSKGNAGCVLRLELLKGFIFRTPYRKLANASKGEEV